ncbi:pyrroline-5-carboxylate reductase ProC [Gottschalkia acidurici 9a]|uniref:Pyrroline-5-carboxylate reductase n=1 Tax=Gottschalkia acidurici (strain ATCC 7906 / DSM 604 / BCRC 14475 / CIP 104303 / KCTC 5404 / NCIMB 10678 / 9a) TaxID=1128398 RepID=K0B4G0_GOTA9|nr:pyrroline-5-carboxylate reductase [Gottschalkia acidurici]AFS79406.1 pyrroline-5-carboxylate reductase ProC [Gottschalkia acidurici 9a]
MYKIGFIGLGNMGYAIVKGLLSSEKGENIAFYDIDKSKQDSIVKELGIALRQSNVDVAKNSKYIILAIKPQFYSECLSEIKDSLDANSVIISIAPGITIDSLKDVFGKSAKIVRVMPNTPSLVSEGMSVLSFSKDNFSEEETEDIKNIFKSCGEIEIIEEKFMDAIVPISGSSPAYIYMMIEALADGGVLLGLPRKLSYKLAAQSVLGSAKMVLETETHPGELKDAVCSPGGTTIEAVAKLEEKGFRSSIIEAMISAYDKTKKLK